MDCGSCIASARSPTASSRGSSSRSSRPRTGSAITGSWSTSEGVAIASKYVDEGIDRQPPAPGRRGGRAVLQPGPRPANPRPVPCVSSVMRQASPVTPPAPRSAPLREFRRCPASPAPAWRSRSSPCSPPRSSSAPGDSPRPPNRWTAPGSSARCSSGWRGTASAPSRRTSCSSAPRAACSRALTTPTRSSSRRSSSARSSGTRCGTTMPAWGCRSSRSRAGRWWRRCSPARRRSRAGCCPATGSWR